MIDLASPEARERIARALAPHLLVDSPYDEVPVAEIFSRPRYLFLKQQIERAVDAALAEVAAMLKEDGDAH